MSFEFQNPLFHGRPRQFGTSSTFQPGLASRAPRRLQPTRPRPRRTEYRGPQKSLSYEVNFVRPPTWLLVPKHRMLPEIARAFEFIPYGFKNAYLYSKDTGTSPFIKSKFKLPKGLTLNYTPFAQHIPLFPKTFMSVVRFNQRLRWTFKRLIQRWRVARLRQANTEDVVTLEVPKNPVYIYDWPNRTKYLFDANTLFRGIRTSLLQAQELFPTPMMPKNPYTNQPLSVAQLHFALNDLRALGKADWVTETLRAAKYEIDIFKRRNNTALRLAALNGLFGKPSDDAYIDHLYDFIEFSHEDAEAEMKRKDVWAWAIEHKHDHVRIQGWRSLCYSYYKALVTLNPDDFAKVKETVMESAAKMIQLPMTDLILLWRAAKGN